MGLLILYLPYSGNEEVTMSVFSPTLRFTLQLAGLLPVSADSLSLRGEVLRYSKAWLCHTLLVAITTCVILYGWCFEFLKLQVSFWLLRENSCYISYVRKVKQSSILNVSSNLTLSFRMKINHTFSIKFKYFHKREC